MCRNSTVYDLGGMVKCEELSVLEEQMRAFDPDENDIYKFLGVEQAEIIKVKKC